MKIRKKLSEDGFTILEVMVGLIIFTLGLLLLMSMMVVSIQGNSWSEYATQSAQLAREKLEQIKNDPAAHLGPGGDEIGDYTRTWNVSSITSDLSAVTVRVAWTDANDKDYACSTMTYIQP